jgi:hypothetical protein
MFSRLLPCVALLGLVVLPGTARPADAKKPAEPAVVVRVQSLDELMSNFRYLATLAGREEEAKQLEGILKEKAGGPKGLEGIDAKRPAGLYAIFGEGGPADIAAIGLIPVADEKAFLGLIENLGYKATKDKDDVYLVAGENLPVPVYFRFVHKHAYVTALNREALLDKDKILTPDKVLPARQSEVLSLTVRIDQVPKNLRDIAIGQVEQQLDAAKSEKKPDESPAEHAARVEFTEQLKNQVVAVLRDGRELALRLNVDQKGQELSAELGIGGQANSALAQQISRLGQEKSLVAGLIGSDSVMSLLVDLPLDPKLAQAMQAVMRENIQKEIEKQPDIQKKDQAAKLYKAFGPALKFTDFDWAFDLRGPHKDGLYTLVGGLKVADGAALDKAVRDVVKDLPEKERGQFHLDVEKAGDVSIHGIDVKGADEGFRKSFGDGPAYFAVRSDAAFLAAGHDALSALKQALKVAPRAGKPVQVEVSMARLADAMAKEKPEAPKAAAKAFGQDKGADKVRFVLEAGQELKLRLVVKAPVLKFLHLMEPGAQK